ncbi:FYVE, RhoGEF and PH domain-containing protein 5-like isoform X2 [Hypomesus transpacificus]|uniref:FYVE, RhoGEF and PH domain-containing protein 5-like isoform X2 n=1 Tax=Hypomesus transpacificus TaxID=137520 RepID=UPI001F07C4F9|nr:FYVE, RhoGEF and PH domain-containing protein 5-like isoform X2 [Hypomesus transpacificus]
MNSEYKKPTVAPKPQLLSQVNFNLSSSLMSRPCFSTRGPKPPIAPKPKVPQRPKETNIIFCNHAQDKCNNGTDKDLDHETDLEDCLSGGEAQGSEGEGLDEDEDRPVEPQFDNHNFSSGIKQLENGSEEQEDKAKEMAIMEEMMQEEEDWRITDRTQTEEVDSLDTLEVSDAGFTIDSMDGVDMIDSDLTDDIDAEGCDAGEALADTDGLSVGDFSVTSIEEEEEACCLCRTVSGREDREMKEDREHNIQGEAEAVSITTHAVTDSLEEEPFIVFTKEHCFHSTHHSSSSTVNEERVVECSHILDIPPNVREMEGGYDEKDLGSTVAQEKTEMTLPDGYGSTKDKAHWIQTFSVIKQIVTVPHSFSERECQDYKDGNENNLLDKQEEPDAFEVHQTLEPHYIYSEDIIYEEQSWTDEKDHRSSQHEVVSQKLSTVSDGRSPLSEYAAIDNYSLDEDIGQIECVSSEDYVEIGDDDDDEEEGNNNRGQSITGPCQKTTSMESEELRAQIADGLLNPNNRRFRLVSISVPADTDSSLASSFSDSQLLSLDCSDVFRNEEDLEGHIVPYLDETTDTEQDLSDEHVYEEAGLDSEGENFLPFDRKSMVMRSRSLSGKVPGCVPETVPEEAGSECPLQKYFMMGYERTEPLLSSSPMLGTARAKISSKPQNVVLYPRSFSMEGRDISLCVYREGENFLKESGHMKRGEDSLSLPCVIGSSGSFSQISSLPSSSLSTPTSVVDIPPPFQLAHISKKPITKSSPSLFIEGDFPDRNKKKKSSFKRFLMLKFRRKTESKPLVDANQSSRFSSESGNHSSGRVLDLDRRSTGSSPQLMSRCVNKTQRSPESPSTFLFYKDGRRKGGSVAFANRNVARVESFEDRSRAPFTPLPLTKPRSISFPNVDTSEYENIPAISSDYENIQIPSWKPMRLGTFAEFFEHPRRVLSSSNETDGYVDMSSLPGFEHKAQSTEQDTESAYTEAYNVCSIVVGPPSVSEGEVGGITADEEDAGRTSEDEDGVESGHDRQTDGRSRAFYIAKELVDTERLHVKALKLLQEDFREAVGAAVGEEGEPVLEDEMLREILNELPDVYTFHRRLLTELENRIRQWEESQRIADVILSRKSEFVVFTTYIGHYDRSMSLLEESCHGSPAFANIVHQFESPVGVNVSLKHQLLQVIVRVAQYRMLLTDYLNNLSPDSKEYEDTQAAIVIVSDIADQANDSLIHGENLLRLVNIEYSVRGQKDLLQPGRVFVKEGTLMKVSRKCRQPRHLFLMNDVLLYTYPQQDGKYRLKNTLPLTGVKVSKPIIEHVQNSLRIEGADISITMSASSSSEREDWFHTLSRTVADLHPRGSSSLSCSGESRERVWLALGEKAPTLVPVCHVMMCMNCTSDFSITLRRHHCHACGRVCLPNTNTYIPVCSVPFCVLNVLISPRPAIQIVCRSCSRNRYPLKYLKDRMAKVCDHCYSELKKRGGDVCGPTGHDSPRPNRSSRPLSAVFQNIHPPSLWKNRKGTASLAQVHVSEQGSVSGSLQRSKRSKRNWKRLWFLLKDKVLYTYQGHEEKVASESLPLLGFTVKQPDRPEGEQQANLFQLYHKKTLYYTFKAEDKHTAQKWVNAMEEATVL